MRKNRAARSSSLKIRGSAPTGIENRRSGSGQQLLAIHIHNEITDEISRVRSGVTTRQYKGLKGLKKENLRENMSDLKLLLNVLVEASTTSISRTERPRGV